MLALLQDLRYDLRMMWRVRTFTAAPILSIALGIGTDTTIFTVVNAVFLRPLPVVVVSHALWRGRFGGDPNLPGRTLTLNNQSFTVIGVATEVTR